MRRTETKDEGTNRGRKYHKLRAKAPQAERKGTRAENRASDERGAECGEKTRSDAAPPPIPFPQPYPREDKTRQDKTRQDKTRQDKTRQDKMNGPITQDTQQGGKTKQVLP